MTGKIIIVGNAIVNTGMVDNAGNVLSNRIGYIGDGQDSNHTNSKGYYIIGPDVTINSLSGSDTEALKQYVNMHLDSEGNPTNLTAVSYTHLDVYKRQPCSRSDDNYYKCQPACNITVTGNLSGRTADHEL